LGQDVFSSPEENDHLIVQGLRSTTARIVASTEISSSPAGQTAIVTLFAQLAMMGLQIDLDVPDVPLVRPQPPLSGERLLSALVEYSEDLMPGGSMSVSATPDVTFKIGGHASSDDEIGVSWTESAAVVVPKGGATPTAGSDAYPIVPIAAGAIAAAEGVRAAVPIVGRLLGISVPEDSCWLGLGLRSASVDFSSFLGHAHADFGQVDVVSAGAITNAALYCLLRLPDVDARMRPIDGDLLGVSNLNRYALARRSWMGLAKIDILAKYSNDRVRIEGKSMMLDQSSASHLGPLAPTVLVGVDDIPSRWTAQRVYSDARVLVASTSHNFVLASEHRPGTSCVGCVHPRAQSEFGDVPTISFVSLWGGLAQVALLLGGTARAMELWPLGLNGKNGLRSYAPRAARGCPLACSAAKDLVMPSGSSASR
jgi:hypothetical protein